MRIVAGTAGGRKIKAPDGQATRPTLERVKEAMFGSVQFELPGARVLDLFAGSGNLGLEALSRGALECVFVDAREECVRLIAENAASLGMSSMARVLRGDALKTAEQLSNEGFRADVILLDPPYRTALLSEALSAICEHGLLSEGGVIVAEHSPDNPPKVPEALSVRRATKKYGDAAVTIFVRSVD